MKRSPSQRPAGRITPPRATTETVLCLVYGAAVVVGLLMRFVGLNWDEGAQLHPDERFLALALLLTHWPASLAQWFNSQSSPLNPENLPHTHYVYGQAPLIATHLLTSAFGSSTVADCVSVGRHFSAVIDCVTVGLTWLLVRRCFRTPEALACAALVALAPLNLQSSHFFTVDSFAACGCALTLLAAVRWTEKPGGGRAAWCGACLGVAVACKLSAVLLLFPVASLFLWAWPGLSRRDRVLFLPVVLVLALFAFRVLQPMAFCGEGSWGFLDLRPEPRFWSDLSTQGAITNGTMDVPFSVQWIGRTPWLYVARNLASWGYGYAFFWCFAAGFCGVLWRLARWRRPTATALAAAVFALALLGVQGAAFSKFTRYELPLTPFAALLAVGFWNGIPGAARWRRAGLLLVTGLTALWGTAVMSIYTHRHTRLAATQWIRMHVPETDRVATETAWDESLPLSWVLPDLGTPPQHDPVETSLDLYSPDDEAKCQHILDTLDHANWIFISSPRVFNSIPRWPARWPLTTAYYADLFSGRLGFALVKEFHSYPRLGHWTFPDDGVDESLTVYDHPRVLLFRKTPRWSLVRGRVLLQPVPLPQERLPSQPWEPALAPAPDPQFLPVPPRGAS